MANKKNQDLFDTLRNSGLRKRVAKTIAGTSRKTDGRVPAPARKALNDLRSVVGELEHRLAGTAGDRRKAGAIKAARTRKAAAAKRSKSAKKAARTRASRS
jgi:hypothetical protein